VQLPAFCLLVTENDSDWAGQEAFDPVVFRTDCQTITTA
jgi:hypothetical protein